MRGSKWLTDIVCNTISRYRILNDGSCLPIRLGWLIIAFSIVYTTLVSLLSFLDAPRFSPIFTGVCVLIVSIGLSFMGRLELERSPITKEWSKIWKVAVCILGPYIIASAFAWFGSPDTEKQWKQALGIAPLNDWHPIIHTALIYLATLIRRSYRLAVMIQATIFAMLLALLYATFKKYRYNRMASTIVVVLAAATPFSVSLVLVLWKDTAFAFAGLALTICLINIWETQGDWLKPWRIVLVVLLLFLASFLRHNGFFYSLPLAVLLPFAVSKRNMARTLICAGFAVLISFGYIVVRTKLINCGMVVNSEHQGFSEAVGLPMCIMSESYVTHPERTPSEVVEFLETFGDREFWEKNYSGDFNSIKFVCYTQQGTIPGVQICAVGRKKFFDLLSKTIKANPVSAIKALLHITAQAWAPFPKGDGALIGGNKQGWIASEIGFYREVVTRSPIGALITAPGAYMLYVILAFCYGLLRNGWRVCVFALPLLCYQFGAMLLLTGFDWRFFYITVLVGGAVSLVMLSRRNDLRLS